MFALRFNESAIERWAEKNTSENYLVFQNEIGPAVQKRGYMSRPEFLIMCEWKSPRTKSRCARNSDAFIREVTGASLAASHEQLRVQVLTLLVGVGWPTASVILHFCGGSPYPICRGDESQRLCGAGAGAAWGGGRCRSNTGTTHSTTDGSILTINAPGA